MGRGELTKSQWARLEPLLPTGIKPGRPQVRTRRQLIVGIRWRTRTGAPWRDVPERYGSWDRAYDLFRRWQRDGAWARILTQLQAEADAKGLITWDVNVDSTVCRAHQHAAGGPRRPSRPPRHRPRPRDRPPPMPSSRPCPPPPRCAALSTGTRWTARRPRGPAGPGRQPGGAAPPPRSGRPRPTRTLKFAGGTSWEKTRRLPQPSAHDGDLRQLAYQLMDAAGLQRGRLTGIALRRGEDLVDAARAAQQISLDGTREDRLPAEQAMDCIRDSSARTRSDRRPSSVGPPDRQPASTTRRPGGGRCRSCPRGAAPRAAVARRFRPRAPEPPGRLLRRKVRR
ncbi:hypothetical protein SGLAM104S_04153 [Streptomyces glaucescens]